MSASKYNLRRKQRLLIEHPYCCFCGGSVRSTSEDHIPPKACFPSGMHPEGFEFPACEACNQGTRKYDDIFGFYTMALDYDNSNLDEKTFNARIRGLINNYPEALPKFELTANEKRRKLRSMGIERQPGNFLSDFGIFKTTPDLERSMNIAIRKLTCATYYKEVGKPLTTQHTVTGTWLQGNDAKRAPLLQHFDELLPEYRQPQRHSVRNYGRRFCYKFGYKANEDFYMLAAQIGAGVVLLSMTFHSTIKPADPLIMPSWAIGAPWLS